MPLPKATWMSPLPDEGEVATEVQSEPVEASVLVDDDRSAEDAFADLVSDHFDGNRTIVEEAESAIADDLETQVGDIDEPGGVAVDDPQHETALNGTSGLEISPVSFDDADWQEFPAESQVSGNGLTEGDAGTAAADDLADLGDLGTEVPASDYAPEAGDVEADGGSDDADVEIVGAEGVDGPLDPGFEEAPPPPPPPPHEFATAPYDGDAIPSLEAATSVLPTFGTDLSDLESPPLVTGALTASADELEQLARSVQGNVEVPDVDSTAMAADLVAEAVATYKEQRGDMPLRTVRNPGCPPPRLTSHRWPRPWWTGSGSRWWTWRRCWPSTNSPARALPAS